MKLEKKGTLDKSQFMEEIPFDYVQGMIIIEVEINNKKYNLIYDTGAPISVMDTKCMEDFQTGKTFKTKIGDSGGTKNTMDFFELPPIRIGNITASEIGAIEADLSPITSLLGCEKTIHGIIGNNLFRKAIWQIDFQKKVIYFTNQLSKLTLGKDTYKVPMNCGKRGNGHIKLNMDGVEFSFTFDTGYNDYISGTEKLFNKLKAANKDLQFISSKGALNVGLYGKNYGISNIVLLNNITINDLTEKQRYVQLDGKGSNVLGTSFLENYLVTTDWNNCMIYLSPTNQPVHKPFKRYEYGFASDHDDRTLTLTKKWIAHPTSFGDLLGSQVLTINGIDISKLKEEDFCDFLSTELKDLLIEPTLQLTVLKDKVEQDIELHKVQLLPFEKK